MGIRGPVHVLERGDQLRLTTDQRIRVQELHAAMKAEAIPLGERLIGQEADLERQFATKSATPVSLQAATAEIGTTQGALRLAHLRYHLSTLDVLTPEQIRRYGELRGDQALEGHGHGSKGHPKTSPAPRVNASALPCQCPTPCEGSRASIWTGSDSEESLPFQNVWCSCLKQTFGSLRLCARMRRSQCQDP